MSVRSVQSATPFPLVEWASMRHWSCSKLSTRTGRAPVRLASQFRARREPLEFPKKKGVPDMERIATHGIVLIVAGLWAGEVWAQETTAKLDTGDTAWMLASAALVLFMTPGLALFYGGMTRGKNILSTLMHSFFIMGL